MWIQIFFSFFFLQFRQFNWIRPQNGVLCTIYEWIDIFDIYDSIVAISEIESEMKYSKKKSTRHMTQFRFLVVCKFVGSCNLLRLLWMFVYMCVFVWLAHICCCDQHLMCYERNKNEIFRRNYYIIWSLFSSLSRSFSLSALLYFMN